MCVCECVSWSPLLTSQLWFSGQKQPWREWNTEDEGRQEQQQHQQAAVSLESTALPCMKQHQITALRPTHHLFLLFYSAAPEKHKEENNKIRAVCEWFKMYVLRCYSLTCWRIRMQDWQEKKRQKNIKKVNDKWSFRLVKCTILWRKGKMHLLWSRQPSSNLLAILLCYLKADVTILCNCCCTILTYTTNGTDLKAQAVLTTTGCMYWLYLSPGCM